MLTLIALLLPLILSSGCARRDFRNTPRSGYELPVDATSARAALQQFYRNWKDVPHKVGGVPPSTVDCSGLMVIAYKDIFRIHLPRTAQEQARFGREIAPNALQPGDLLFFQTGFRLDHVGIFFKDNLFIHTSSSKGVMISSLNEPYWHHNFVKAARIFDYPQTASRW